MCLPILTDEDLCKLFYSKISSIHGIGLFARSSFKQGDYMGEYDGPIVQQDGMHVLWIEKYDDVWMGRDGKNLLRYLNHSKQPLAEFNGFELYALADIRKDEEVTINYGEEF